MLKQPIQAFDLDVPDEMAGYPQWHLWRMEDGQKIPYQAGGRIRARSNDPTTWSKLDDIEINGTFGLAWCFSDNDPYCGIDLDDCLHDGQLTDWAQEILNRFEGVAYAEVSPSGSGVKLTTRAKKPGGSTCKHLFKIGKQAVECYDRKRFWTWTGQCVSEGFTTIGDGQAAVDWLAGKYLKRNEPNPAEPKAEAGHKHEPSNGASLSLLDRAQRYVDGSEPGHKGNLRDNAFKLSGHLHALVGHFGERLSDSEVLQCLRRWNARNTDRLRDDELQHVVVNGRKNGAPPPDKPPADGPQGKAGEQNGSDGRGTGAAQIEQLTPVSVASLKHDHPDLRSPVVHGFLRQGETANIIAPPKTGKSFLAGNLAWCVATGRPWLSHDVEQGPVLVIDNELHKETLANRLTHIADELQVPLAERDQVEVTSLRGKLAPIDQLQFTLAIEPGRYSLVIFDALYRMIPSGTSENDNAGMMAIYNHLDMLAAKWECAIVVVHHTSKGGQGEKSLTDLGAGAGSISRAADTHIAIRPHETDGHHVLEAVTRSFKSPDPVSVTFQWPLWQATTLDPAVKKPSRGHSDKTGEDKKAIQEMYKCLPASGKPIQQEELFESAAVGAWNRSKRIADLMVKSRDDVQRKKRRKGKKEVVLYRIVTPEVTPEVTPGPEQ